MRGNCNSDKNNISILTNIHHHHMFLSLLALLKGNVKRELNKFKARPRVYNLCCRITSLVFCFLFSCCQLHISDIKLYTPNDIETTNIHMQRLSAAKVVHSTASQWSFHTHLKVRVMVIVEDSPVTMKCRTAINALYLHFNLYLCVQLESHTFVYIHIISD